MATKKSADKGSPKAKAKGKSTTNKGGKGKGGKKTEPKSIEVPVIIPVAIPTDSDAAITVNSTATTSEELAKVDNVATYVSVVGKSMEEQVEESIDSGKIKPIESLTVEKFDKVIESIEESSDNEYPPYTPPQKRFKRCAAVDEEARRRGR